MTTDHDGLQAWAQGWKETGKVLDALRRKEMRRSVLTDVIPLFDSALRSALWLDPVKPYSGLVEFHKRLEKLR